MKTKGRVFKTVLVFLGAMTGTFLLPGNSKASPVGKPHECPIEYLRGRSAIKGTAVVSFLIDKSGYVENPAIIASSGNAQIDGASLECVKRWHYFPAMNNRKPIEVRWTVDIAWNPPVLPDMTRIVRDCSRAVGTRKEYADFQGETDFKLVYEERKLSSVVVTHPSGNPKLDQEETDCFKTTSELKREIVVVVADESTAEHFDFSSPLSFEAQISLNKSDYSATIGPMGSSPASK